MQLKLKNFRCHENAVFEFYDGIMLVKGASGSGKSSIFEAINFCLYGEGKKIIKYGNKSCEVEMTWKNYIIKRVKTPNRFNIYDISTKKIYEDSCAQEVIFSIFGKYFMMGGYLSQMNTNSFITLNSVDKLKFLEKIAFGEGNNIEELKERRKKVSKKLETNLIEVRSKIEFVAKMNEKDPIDESIREYNFPVRCKVADRAIAEKNTETIIKNETCRINKNKFILSLKKKEYDDVKNLETRVSDIEEDIAENTKRIDEIRSVIRSDGYAESEYIAMKDDLMRIKREINSSLKIIKENEDDNIKIYKSKKTLKIYKSKIKDLDELDQPNNLENLQEELTGIQNAIAKKEISLKIVKLKEELGKNQAKLDLLKEKEKDAEINIGKLNEMYTEEELNTNISFYKKYTKNIVEYNRLKTLYSEDINYNEEYIKICKEIEQIKESESIVVGKCPACGEHIRESEGEFVLYKPQEECRSTKRAGQLYWSNEKTPDELSKCLKDLEREKNEMYKRGVESELTKKKIMEYEEMYEKLDSYETSIENYNYYVDLKKERTDLESKVNEFSKLKPVILDLDKKIKEKEKEIAACVSHLEKMPVHCIPRGATEIPLVERSGVDFSEAGCKAVDFSEAGCKAVDLEEAGPTVDYNGYEVKDLKDMIDRTKENIYKVNSLIEEKKKLGEKIEEIGVVIDKIERKSIDEERVRSIKMCIDEMTGEEERINSCLVEMEIKRNKITGLNTEQKRLEDQNKDKQRQCQKIKNEHMREYSYSDEYVKKEIIYSDVQKLEEVIREKNEIKLKNEKIKEEIKKWNENMGIVKKNKERRKEMADLKEEENGCIQYCTAIDVFKRKIIETESMLLGQLIGTINAYANIYLDGFFQDQIITAELSPYKKLKKSSKNQINLIITYRGEECDFGNLSGGEQTRIILAYTMAFSEILSSPVVMLDEAMASLDQDTTDTVSKTIKYNCKNKIIILIAHQVVQGNFDRTISLD